MLHIRLAPVIHVKKTKYPGMAKCQHDENVLWFPVQQERVDFLMHNSIDLNGDLFSLNMAIC